MEHLFEELRKHSESDIYPYHMPGHKRRPFGMLPGELSRIDITEIDGFDNLHQPEGILDGLQREAAGLYGAEESFYLVNGSTCGILSAVSCALPEGGHILMARNCHRSAYHGIYLRGLRATYLYPPYLEEYGIYDALEPEEVRRALEREPDIGAVLVVSPTYEGRISDIRAIADIVHERGIPLIVDEAHGAHLGLADGFPKNSCQQGADLVIHSVHKTLPALTQTALLHVNGQRIDRGLLRRFLRIYQSSSPSYLLMAGIDNALRYVGLQGQEAFGAFRQRFEAMLDRLRGCRHLRFLTDAGDRQDTGKLLISTKQSGLTGKQLYDILLGRYHLQPEMASTGFVLAMFTVNDREEAYRRMTEALLAIDGALEEGMAHTPEKRAEGRAAEAPGSGEYRPGAGALCGEGAGESAGHGRNRGTGRSGAIPLAKAWDMPTEQIALAESEGRYIGEFINLYPPGVPLLVPGERMTGELIGMISEAEEQGLEVQGVGRRKGAGGFLAELYVPAILEEIQDSWNIYKRH
ncbi:aminotransferase class I/II-fold pyridoxal phosphate-dependent enzyme [uncultured Acetatifactor sp.]|uniref:aminotransferase class I/II-fold pyridoxal phosphate-dependent enzyme n=1 Tax=uncultured Acetatifactor sp. TaxID=1671927 RepID=UPI002639F2CC|nr:PLP-dependent transferase [uncultured Acetatifactor sp.]